MSYDPSRDNPAKRPEVRLKISLALSGEKNGNWKPKIQVKCPICGRQFYVTESRLKRRKYCSSACGYQAISVRMSHGNPMFSKRTAMKVVAKNGIRGHFDNGGVLGKLWRENREYMLAHHHFRTRNPMKNPDVVIRQMVSARQNAKRPNNFEKDFIAFLEARNLPFKYVGDAKFFITCRGKVVRNPDFIHSRKGEHMLIEIGNEFVHNDEEVKEMICQYSSVGWKALFFYEDDFYANPNRVWRGILRAILKS